ncbi:MAG: TonB-dependent receptor [Ekhidna sp.]
MIACLFVLAQVTAQRTVSGKVTDDSGEGLPGVNVVIKGTTTGTTTDLDGNYRLSVNDSDVLVFSYVGFEAQEINVGTRSVIDVTLGGATELQEVVVVGYGTQLKKEFTGSSSQISGDDIAQIPTPDVTSLLQGRGAGVQVQASSGLAGSAISVRVRGASSVSSSNEPLYVIDGVILTNEDLSSPNGSSIGQSSLTELNPNEIESIEVLKDASATAIYGARGSNGVVLITTKSGKSGKTRFNFGYYTGVQQETNRLEMLNAAQYTELFNESATNSFGPGNPFLLDPDNIPFDTDWIDAVLRKGRLSEYNFSASGGNDKTTFFVGGTYYTEEGYIITNKFDRYNLRTNINHQASDKLSFGLNMGLSHVNLRNVSSDNSVSGPLSSGVLQYPNIPIYGDGSATYGPEGEFYYGNGVNAFNNISTNTVADASLNTLFTRSYRNISNAYAQYKITPELTVKGDVGVDLLFRNDEIFWSRSTLDGSPTGFGDYQNRTIVNWTNSLTASYDKTFADDHKVGVLIGTSAQKSVNDRVQTQGQDFPSDDFRKLNNSANITFGTSTQTQFTFLSYFGRANYAYQGKYLFGLSVRSDGSSRFGADNKFGTFYALSGGWVISDEAFLASDVLTFLKLRGSWGTTGNADLTAASVTNNSVAPQNFAPLGLYAGASYAAVPGIAPNQLAVPDLKWETTTQFDIGIDAELLDGRISLTADYFVKKVEDMVLNVTIPATSGFLTIWDNVGEAENKGLEFSVTSRNVVGDFNWTTSFNIGTLDNKITELDDKVITGLTTTVVNAREGAPIGAFFTNKYAGVDPDTGDALYFDLEGNTTNQALAADRQIVGDPFPDYFGGITNTFGYKGIELSVFFQFSKGNEIYNNAGRFRSNNMNLFFNQTVDQLNRWQNPGDITDVPQARLFGNNGNVPSSRYVEDGSYLRLKTLNVSYNLPSSVIGNTLRSAQIFFRGTNLWTLTNYSGWDPEVNTGAGSPIEQGVDFLTAPQAKRITFGVNLGL